jgi:hypothetical protein
MDATGFDSLTRALAGSPSRRGIVRALTGLGLGGLWIFAEPSDSSAKSCKKKKCSICKQCKSGKCKPKPTGTSCGTCRHCEQGVCINETGPKCGVCRHCENGACVKETGTSCSGGGTCQNGSCRIPCGSGSCALGQFCVNPNTVTCATNQGTCKQGDDICAANAPIPCGPVVGGPTNSSCACFTAMNGRTRCGQSFAGCGACTTNADCAGFGPGAFCIRDTGEGCLCGPNEGFCAAACPS